MEKVYEKKTYPCGYISEQRVLRLGILSWIFQTIGFEKEREGCPLHGTNCPKKK